MNNQYAADETKRAIMKHKKIKPGKRLTIGVSNFPQGSERQYIHIVNQYYGILRDLMNEYYPKIIESYKEARDEDVKEKRNDSLTGGIDIVLMKLFSDIKNKLTQREEAYQLEAGIRKAGESAKAYSIRQWKTAIHKSLSIDIREDYYMGDFFKENMDKWVSDNVNLIVTMPGQSLDKMKDKVLADFEQGKRSTDMAKDLQRLYSIDKKHAKFIARDQTAKLNGQITRAQQKDAGINKYVWCTSLDERVRPSHAELEGQICDWDDPPMNSDGRACHPGEDFNCRCTAEAVIDLDNISLPIDDSEE